MAQPSSQEEVAGLDRVLTRLAMTDDEKLEGVSTQAQQRIYVLFPLDNGDAGQD